MRAVRAVFSLAASLKGGKSLKKRMRKRLRTLRSPERRRATAWCRKHSSDLDAYAESVASDVWAEALAAKRAIGALRRERLASLSLHGSRASDIGGGPANLALLFWLVRVLRPEVVVETGVASGASSRAILEAMERNGAGRLLSSDLAGIIPKEFAGLCVDASAHARWTLFHDGDRANIPEIVARVETIDLLHYDSAKSAVEMGWVMGEVAPKLSQNAVVVLDDVDRHDFMQRFVETTDRSWQVFGPVGVIGLQEALSAGR